MDSRLTAKLFHTIVVLGVGLTAAGCGDDDTGNTKGAQTTGTSSGTSGSVALNGDGGGASSSSGAPTGSSTSSTSGSSTSGWFCCG